MCVYACVLLHSHKCGVPRARLHLDVARHGHSCVLCSTVSASPCMSWSPKDLLGKGLGLRAAPQEEPCLERSLLAALSSTSHTGMCLPQSRQDSSGSAEGAHLGLYGQVPGSLSLSRPGDGFTTFTVRPQPLEEWEMLGHTQVPAKATKAGAPTTPTSLEL